MLQASLIAPEERACDWAQAFEAVPDDWRACTAPFLASPQGQVLLQRLQQAQAHGQAPVYPQDVFAALRATPRQAVRVVILGQDPYHGPGQAHGLAFSVPPGVAIPPSLRNIRQELQRDLGLDLPAHGCLQSWAQRGVLLLNTCLSVAAGQAGSHAGWGWEALTDALIAAVARGPGPRVFLLWGAHAQRKAAGIQSSWLQGGRDPQGLLVLQANHPSPLSARRPPLPFVGCGHFGRAQAFLRQAGQDWDWSLT